MWDVEELKFLVICKPEWLVDLAEKFSFSCALYSDYSPPLGLYHTHSPPENPYIDRLIDR